MAQLVKNPPAMQETWVRSLGWEDTLEKGKATHSSILAWRIPWTVAKTHGVANSWERLSLYLRFDHSGLVKDSLYFIHPSSNLTTSVNVFLIS